MYNKIIDKIKSIQPDALKWFSDVISIQSFREILGREEADYIIAKLLESEGFPDSINPDDVNYDLVITNKSDAETLIEGYIQTETDIEADDNDAKIKSTLQLAFRDKRYILDFRLRDLTNLNFQLTIHDDLEDFLEHNPVYSPEHLAERLEDLYEEGELKRIIESKEARDYNTEIFEDEFSRAVTATHLPGDDFDSESTSVKVIELKLEYSWERYAEEYGYLTTYSQDGDISDYVDNALYKDLLENDLVFYRLEIDEDLEDLYAEYS